jgi:hypothetical protein
LYNPIQIQVVIGIGWLKRVDTNKPCTDSKIFEFATQHVHFSNSEHIHFTNSIHNNIHNNITRVKNDIHNVVQFNSQIVYSQQYSQHRSSIFTLFLSTSIEFTVQIPNLSYKQSSGNSANVSFLSKNLPCAWNTSWCKNMHMSNITWSTLLFCISLSKRYVDSFS